jgi:hypothetical protein
MAKTSFKTDILPLFTQIDIAHMANHFDLSKYNDVKTNAQHILARLKAQGGAVMPPPSAKGGDGPWPPEKIALFQTWIDDGCLP